MLIIKFNSGSLGHFLAAVILNLTDPKSVLDYGVNVGHMVLHTGAYTNQNDVLFLKQIKTEYFGITHNNPLFEQWICNLKNTQSIFIDLDSNFVEYRLNYIFKMPEWNKKLNDCATNNSWKNFKNPVAYDDARRIVRLHQKVEQQIKPSHNDIICKFENFYIENKNMWVENFIKIAKMLSINLPADYVEKWFECFQIGQKAVIERASLIYRCIENKKFDNSLNENEKGIVIGYDAVKNNTNDPIYFEQKYYEFSKN
tara:strand:+ start:82 stop:849 length:768 start_codon:yes stop_codon:yes gene_type:complete